MHARQSRCWYNHRISCSGQRLVANYKSSVLPYRDRITKYYKARHVLQCALSLRPSPSALVSTYRLLILGFFKRAIRKNHIYIQTCCYFPSTRLVGYASSRRRSATSLSCLKIRLTSAAARLPECTHQRAVGLINGDESSWSIQMVIFLATLICLPHTIQLLRR